MHRTKINPSAYNSEIIISQDEGVSGVWTTGMVVDYTGLDDCRLIVETEDGSLFEPAEVVSDFILEAGQCVKFKYEILEDMASTCMVGPIVKIHHYLDNDSWFL